MMDGHIIGLPVEETVGGGRRRGAGDRRRDPPSDARLGRLRRFRRR
jgi:hypothetical protein